MLITATSVLVSLCLILSAVCYHIMKKPSSLRSIPGPPCPNYLLGHVFQTIGSVANWRIKGNYPEPYLSWIKKYGNVVYVREIINHVILLSDPKAIQHVLVTNVQNYPRDPLFDSYFSDILFGIGLLSSHGTQHDQFRKMLNPLFMTSQIKQFIPIFNEHAQVFCDEVLAQASASKTCIDIKHVFKQLALKTIGIAAFGFRFDDFPEAHDAYENYQMELSPLMLMGVFLIPGFLHFPLPQFQRRLRAKKVLKEIMLNVIKQKLSTPKSEAKDLLDLILPNAATTQDALVHIMTLMTAGHETTSIALAWIFATLSKHPGVAAKIRSERDNVVAEHGGLSTWDAVNKLKYTLAVIQECLRLHTVVYALLQRIATADDVIPMSDGTNWTIPAGTAIEMTIAAIHRNEKYWTNPQEFIPDRFMEGTNEWNADLALRSGKNHSFHYFPFSGGSKACIGPRFALSQMQILVATITSQYSYVMTVNSDLRQKFTGITLQPVHVEMQFSSIPLRAGAH